MYSEVPFHTHDQCSSFRDFVIAHTEQASRVFSGNAFGSAFSFKSTHEVGKRFIVWRVQDNKLELIDLCFEQELQNNAIRIHFPHQIIPTVAIIDYSQSSNDFVCVFVLTAGRVLYRFIFPHPATLARNNATRHLSIFESITARDIDSPNTSVPLSLRRTSETPTYCGASSPIHFGVACSTQIFLIRLTSPNNTHFTNRPSSLAASETEYPEHGLIASYLPLMRRSQPPIYGLALLDNYSDIDDPLVFALSASKLHVYSKRVNEVYSLAEDETEDDEGSVYGGLIRLSAQVEQNYVDLRVVVARFRENDDNVEILAFVGKHEKTNSVSFHLERSSCQSLASKNVLDFAVGAPLEEFTWVLSCNSESDFAVYNSIPPKQEVAHDTSDTDSVSSADFEHVTMSKKKTHSWSEALLLQKATQPPDVYPAAIDDADAFYWDILHRHGQFDRHTIANALALLDPPRDKELRAPLPKNSYSRLQSAATAIVRKVIDDEIEQDNYDPMRHTENVWGRLWAYCVRQWESANTPVGLHVDVDTGLYLVIRQSTVGLFRKAFPIESVAWSSGEGEEEENGEGHFTQDEDVDNLWRCCSYVLEEMGYARLIRFDCDLAQNQTEIHQLGSDYTEHIIESSSDAESHFVTKFKRYFHVLANPVEAANRLIDIINEQSVPEDTNIKTEFRNACALASAAGGVSQLADARYRVSTGLFLTLNVVSRLRTGLLTPPPVLAQLTSSVYDTAARMVRLHSGLSWLVAQPFDRPSLRWAPVESQFGNMSLGLGAPPTLVEGYVRESTFTIPQHLAHDVSHTVSHVGLQVCSSLDIESLSPHPFMEFLVRQEQWGAIEKLVQRLEGLQPVDGRGVVKESLMLQDLKGCALLHMGKYDLASEVLASVASYIAEDKEIAESVIGPVHLNEGLTSLPSQRGLENCPVALKWFYCLKVARMFEAHRQFQHAERFYESALPHSCDPHIHLSPIDVQKEVILIAWSSIFNARTTSDPPRFEPAYTALTQYPDFPDSERSLDSLRHLVTMLCDSGKEGVAVLHKLPFAGKGVMRTVTSHLLNKARFSDLPNDLANPLNYYTVLYSFLVTREKFREAAKCMYEYSLRITSTHLRKEKETPSSSSFSPPLDKHKSPQNPYFFQSQALLIAINALKIVDVNYQWISAEKQQATKRKRNENTDTTTYSISVTLEEMEKAHSLATAHSFLWTTGTKNPKLGLELRGAGPSVQETFLMLINAENYKLAFELAGRFSLDPKPVVEALAEKYALDPLFDASPGWNVLKQWLELNDSVPTRKDISPSRMLAIIKERNVQHARGADEDRTASATAYNIVGNLVEKVVFRDERDERDESGKKNDPSYFARIGDTRSVVDIRLNAPLPPSIKIGQPLLISSQLVPSNVRVDPSRMDDGLAQAQETLRAVRVVALRQNTQHGFHGVVADKLLTTNPRIVLPIWLVRWFADSVSDYSELLRIYLTNNRIVDACFIAIDMIETAAIKLEQAQTPTQVVLPYTLIDNLYSLLEDAQAKKRLDNELQRYFNILDQKPQFRQETVS